MPHLSPIIWTTLYFMIWTIMLLLVTSTEYHQTSPAR